MDVFCNLPDVLDVRDLQRVLKIGRSTAYRLIADGKLSHLKIGRKVVIPKRYLEIYVEKSSNLCYTNEVMVGKTARQRKE